VKAALARLWQAPALLMTVTILLWAGNSIIGRAVHDAVPPILLAAARWVGASLLLAPFALPRLRQDWPALRQKLGVVLLLGVLGVGMFNILLYSGLHYTQASNSLLIQAATSPLILCIGAILFGDRTSTLKATAMALSVAGVLVIVGRGDLTVLRHLRLGTGEALTLFATLVWAFYTVLLRLRPDVHPTSFSLMTFAIGAAVTAPLAMVEWLGGARPVLAPGALAGIAYVAIFPSLIGYLLYNRAVEISGPALPAQFVNSMPLAGSLMAIVLLGERLAFYHVIGMLLILAGLVTFMRGDRHERAPLAGR
jgi:drug/metabolite transporter (DMT)-like permease